MGAKSRENYPIGGCEKFDCLNRDVECEHCYGQRLYRHDPSYVVEDIHLKHRRELAERQKQAEGRR